MTEIECYSTQSETAKFREIFPYKIYPMRTIKIKYAILYLLSIHLMNTVYSTIISIVTFYSPHIPKLGAIAPNIKMGRGTRLVPLVPVGTVGSYYSTGM